MRKLVVTAVASGLTLLAAATFAGSQAPLHVSTTTTTAPPPRLTALPKLRLVPLSASALAGAKADLARTYPRAATSSSPVPLMLDVSHWQASSGGLSGTLAIAGAQMIGAAPGSPPLWQSEANGTAVMTLSGLQQGALYLLDFAAQADDGTSVNANVCWSNNPMNCMGTTVASGTMTFSAGHALFGFMAAQSDATIFVSNIPSGAIASGFTLHPAS